MRATKSSRASRTSKVSPRRNDEPGASLGEFLAVAVVLLLLGGAAAAWHHSQGFPLYYGDAEARLNIARRVVDSRTPGYDQIGTVWLPLPAALTIPFVRSMELWQSGMAATIPGVLCFVLAGTMLFGTARQAFGTLTAGAVAALVFAFNPNLLYLATTPMSEPVSLAMVCGTVFATLRG